MVLFLGERKSERPTDLQFGPPLQPPWVIFKKVFIWSDTKMPEYLRKSSAINEIWALMLDLWPLPSHCSLFRVTATTPLLLLYSNDYHTTAASLEKPIPHHCCFSRVVFVSSASKGAQLPSGLRHWLGVLNRRKPNSVRFAPLPSRHGQTLKSKNTETNIYNLSFQRI